MKFDKHHKVEIKTLNDIEAGVYLNFLLTERIRHQATVEMCGAWIEFWHSEFQRQLNEVWKIDERIEKLKRVERKEHILKGAT